MARTKQTHRRSRDGLPPHPRTYIKKTDCAKCRITISDSAFSEDNVSSTGGENFVGGSDSDVESSRDQFEYFNGLSKQACATTKEEENELQKEQYYQTMEKDLEILAYLKTGFQRFGPEEFEAFLNRDAKQLKNEVNEIPPNILDLKRLPAVLYKQIKHYDEDYENYSISCYECDGTGRSYKECNYCDGEGSISDDLDKDIYSVNPELARNIKLIHDFMHCKSLSVARRFDGGLKIYKVLMTSPDECHEESFASQYASKETKALKQSLIESVSLLSKSEDNNDNDGYPRSVDDVNCVLTYRLHVIEEQRKRDEKRKFRLEEKMKREDLREAMLCKCNDSVDNISLKRTSFGAVKPNSKTPKIDDVIVID